jgi:hypothetical protein
MRETSTSNITRTRERNKCNTFTGDSSSHLLGLYSSYYKPFPTSLHSILVATDTRPEKIPLQQRKLNNVITGEHLDGYQLVNTDCWWNEPFLFIVITVYCPCWPGPNTSHTLPLEYIGSKSVCLWELAQLISILNMKAACTSETLTIPLTFTSCKDSVVRV